MSERNDRNEPWVGEKFTVVDDITVGDLVYYDRAPDGRLFIRRLREWEVNSFAGRLYRVERGEAPNQVQLRSQKQGQTPS
jgi:hypothetical protein